MKKFETDNEAFSDYRAYEIKRILMKIADNIENGKEDGIITDINGNKIGSYKLT